MENMETVLTCDILVVGAGIAGIMAAIEAARQNQKVVLMSSTHIFSGSSFYPGTWGLGLITPEDEEDEEDLIQTIRTVGCGMADESMVRSFVAEMRPTIEYLKEIGLQLKDAKEKNQKEFIPCFDYKTRNWHGVVADKARDRFKELLQELEVILLPYCELVDVVEENHRVTGAIICEKKQELSFIGAKAVILATGGYGGLFEKKLTTSDITGTGQYIALEHGCTLVNMEFMQMMPALVDKEGKASNIPIIFNERTFGYATLQENSISGETTTITCDQKLLERRATYGPFTGRMPSREIDFLIASHEKEGLQVVYNKELLENMPEFISTYFNWLKEKRNITPDREIRISMFAHAANGGIKINTNGATELRGLFACGEVTGGMHGADRIGGLSTANGLVFGRKAGLAASTYAKECQELRQTRNIQQIYQSLWEIPNRDELKKKLQHIMMESSMVIRNEHKLQKALKAIRLWKEGISRNPTTDITAYVESRNLWGQLQLASGILQAECLRKESRGSHYRADYPNMDKNYAQRIEIRLNSNCVSSKFEE